MNENEIWLPVVGFEGLYEISNMGRVKSLKYDKEKILKQDKNNNGYLKVCLFKEGKRKYFQTHRLVAIAFLENPNNYPCVNHKDENPSNNCVDNLEWCDAKYNTNYGTCKQRISEKLINGIRSKKVFQYTLNGELVGILESTHECGRNGYNEGNVAACCRNCYMREGNNIYKGYIWSYQELKKQD